MKKFDSEITKNLGYYVYRLIDPRNGNTFYIGKGKGNRLFEHVNAAINLDEDKYDDEISSKLSTIREIISKGFEVIHIIQRWGLTEKEAKEVEAALIDATPGLDNAIRGYDTERGSTTAKEILDRFYTDQFKINSNDEKFVVIKIKQETHNNKGNYDATRFSWVLNYAKVKKYKIVLSTIKGIVVEVYRVDKWNETNDKKRCYFEGHPAENEVRMKYYGKRLPDKFVKKGLANPALYSDKRE